MHSVSIKVASCFLLLATGIFPLLAQSATDVELYREKVVISQNAAQKEQNEAVADAFERVLVRVTGQDDALVTPEIRKELSNGSRYLTSFRFDSSDEFFTNILGEQVPTKSMILEFDENAVNSLLLRNQLPVWGSRRPDVLVWIADRSDADRIPSDSESSELTEALAVQADRRGLPYLLPIMDLTDTLALGFPELFGLFSQDIEAASARYESEAVLAGRLESSGEEYQADWLILFKGERIRVPRATGTLEEVVTAGVDAVSSRLAAQYAYVLDPNLLGSMQIQVLDVPDAQTFAAIEAYLGTVNLISQATVSSFIGDDITFNLQVSGDQLQLADVLALDGKLVPQPEMTLLEQLDNRLVYRWQSE